MGNEYMEMLPGQLSMPTDKILKFQTKGAEPVQEADYGGEIKRRA